MNIGVFLETVVAVSAVVLILFVAIFAPYLAPQQRGASLGAGFGGSGELNTERRGLEKSLYDTTIVVAVVFAVSILSMLFV